VDIQYFVQSGGFNFHAAGSDQTLPADGQFHELCFPLAGIPSLNFVEQHGLNLRGHSGGNLIIDIDRVRALAGPCVSAPAPALSLGAWLGLCVAGILAGALLLRRRVALSA
jgi:hypothetical protein